MGWRSAAAERARILLRAAAILRERRLELAALEVRECAKPWAEADADVCEAIDFLEYYARGAIELDARTTAAAGAGRAQHAALRAARRHRGDLAVELPAGDPRRHDLGGARDRQRRRAQARRAVAGLRACARRGAARRRRSARRARACSRATGATGAALVRHPAVDTIAFTGSSAVGREILRAAARDLDAASSSASSPRWAARTA